MGMGGGGHTAHALQRGGAAASWHRGSAVAAPRRGGRDGAARAADFSPPSSPPTPGFSARRDFSCLFPLLDKPPPGVNPPP